MRNGKLLAEDKPQKLIDIYRINVSISAENFIFKSDNNKNIVPLLYNNFHKRPSLLSGGAIVIVW